MPLNNSLRCPLKNDRMENINKYSTIHRFIQMFLSIIINYTFAFSNHTEQYRYNHNAVFRVNTYKMAMGNHGFSFVKHHCQKIIKANQNPN